MSEQMVRCVGLASKVFNPRMWSKSGIHCGPGGQPRYGGIAMVHPAHCPSRVHGCPVANGTGRVQNYFGLFCIGPVSVLALNGAQINSSD